ncbi:uncharacterized protein LOC114335001 [Diabrotica virgifera virgifera]|uniref:Uncharacterized protein LOC114335001 isoform X2 n=1 Tax=Diabrotica virgifera virgifera TaxID=50390 RepID=A0A6P7G1N9_DIAVI|nr:uncharacterized protein LOC114335001 [Diabrotica virgifera virgifera]
MILRILIITCFISMIYASRIITRDDPVPDESACICHHGYTIQKHPKDNKFYCKGILHDGKTACVNLERPQCKCTLIKGFVIQDIYRYWCVKVKPGYVEEIRWDCENKKEWDRFFDIYPEERPSADSQL